MGNRRERMHLIPHTHWDREWYLPFERFRHRLVQLIDHLLDILEEDPDFRCFHLDAQTIVVEDYLEIRPRKHAELRQRIHGGRIHVGPWYVQNDEFLVSGEATIRNLLIGTRTAAEYGCRRWIGYIPDQFGHISQLPAILHGFGIDTALMGRGRALAADESVEFRWRGADGTVLLSVFMPLWYNNAQRLPEAPGKLRNLLTFLHESLAPRTPSGQLLLMNGVDHLEPQENLTAVLRSIPPSWGLPPIAISRLPEYFAAVKDNVRPEDLPLVSGELREGSDGMILNGTLSSRPYLKQANQHCEFLLERILEPLAVLCAQSGLAPWPGDELHYCWRLLIRNHPHDSICGCSTDAVHRDNMNRFRHVRELAGDLVSERFEALALAAAPEGVQEGDYKVLVFNPSPVARSENAVAEVDLPEEQSVSDLALFDDAGKETPFIVLDERRLGKRFISPVNLPGARQVRRITILFSARAIPGCGYRTWLLRPGTKGRKRPAPDSGDGPTRTMENEFLTVRVHKDGSLTVTDKRSGIRHRGWNVFVDEGDAGDLYNFRALPGDVPLTSRGVSGKVRRIERNPLREVVEVSLSLDLPVGVSFDKNRRRRKTRRCDIVSRIVLNRNEPFVRISTTIHNRSRDHRLRVHFRVPEGAESALADCPFDVVERPASSPPEWERQVEVNPMRTFVAAGDGRNGVAVFARGIYAQELTRDHTLALTLVRCTGRISGGDALTVTEDSLTSDSQLLGEHTFEYAVMPFSGPAREADLPALAEAFALPLVTFHVPADPDRLEGGRPWGPEDRTEYAKRPRPGSDRTMPSRHSLVTLSNRNVMLSAVKQAESRDTVVVRIWNPTDRDRRCTVRFGFPVSACHLCRLDERRLGRLPLRNNTVRLVLPPHAILTLDCRPRKPADQKGASLR